MVWGLPHYIGFYVFPSAISNGSYADTVRDKVIGKKWVYLERNTVHRVGAISEGKTGTRGWGCQFLEGWIIS